MKNKIISNMNSFKESKKEDAETPYDSYGDTMKHIMLVRKYMSAVSDELLKRGIAHDKSKLESPEKEYFDEYTKVLDKITYNSPEYKDSLEKIDVALQHHYKNNTHHPQHYKNGIDGMDLFDVIEMLFDWKASTKRNKDGDIRKSIDLNKDRFEMSEQLVNIFKNTITNIEKNSDFK